MNEIQKRTDRYAVQSATNLKAQVAKEVKSVFITALKCIEMKFGRDFDGFEAIRAEILRAGNDAIRRVEDVLDTRYNIEIVPTVIKVQFTPEQK